MKTILIPFLVACLFAVGVNAQISYDIDTSGMSVQRAADTIFQMNSKLETKLNFRFQQSETSGVILVKTAKTPSISIFDSTTTKQNVLYPGKIELKDSAGNIKLAFRTDHNSTGDSRIITDEIQIEGGSDLAELFDVTDAKEEVIPGLLVSLDPKNPGKLMLSSKAYDTKVAGVLSGANGVKPGILMGQDETIATGDNLVTLSGRTFVKANTENGAIKVGDLITTSDIAGQAMKATKRKKSRGAVIGKAMTELENGTGYILVLINLQ